MSKKNIILDSSLFDDLNKKNREITELVKLNNILLKDTFFIPNIINFQKVSDYKRKNYNSVFIVDKVYPEHDILIFKKIGITNIIINNIEFFHPYFNNFNLFFLIKNNNFDKEALFLDNIKQQITNIFSLISEKNKKEIYLILDQEVLISNLNILESISIFIKKEILDISEYINIKKVYFIVSSSKVEFLNSNKIDGLFLNI